MTPVLTPGSSIRAAYDSAVAAGRGAQADDFVRRGYDRSALDANVLAALATWGHVEVGSLPHASRQGGGTGGRGDTCLCIRPASSGKWGKSRTSRVRPLTDKDREYIAALPAPIPVPAWTARELRILHGIAASFFGGAVFAELGSAVPRPGKRDGNVIAGADYIVPRVRKDSEGVNYVVEPSLSAHGMSVHLAWSGRNAQWRVVAGARQYHVPRNVSARQALCLALAGWRWPRRATAAAAARPELAHIYVSREHSLAAGNCQPITDSFARSAWSAIGAVGECAVRADVVLGLRDDAYTRGAIALASSGAL